MIRTRCRVRAKQLFTRERPNHQIVEMIEMIKKYGGVLEPIHMRGETDEVIVGHRRVIAVQQMLEDPNLDPKLKAAITTLDAIMYTEMTEDEMREVARTL